MKNSIRLAAPLICAALLSFNPGCKQTPANEKNILTSNSFSLSIQPVVLDTNDSSGFPFSIYLKNNTGDSVNIKRATGSVSFLECPPGWKRKEHAAHIYNGPAISKLARGDSAYFGYNLADFFDPIIPSDAKIPLQFSFKAEELETELSLADVLVLKRHD